jgi:hypothetical protein
VKPFRAPPNRAYLAAAVILLFANIAQGRTNETKHLQVLINSANPSFKFVINDGAGLHYNNPFHPRPFGSNYILNGLIYPAGTINIAQTDYTVDTHRVPLTAENSIGEWQCVGNVLADLLNLPNVPPQPTIAELITWVFFFKHSGKGDPDNVYASGAATTGVLAPNQPLFNVLSSVVGGTGRNNNIGGDLKAEVYFQKTTGIMLINVAFDNFIKY